MAFFPSVQASMVTCSEDEKNTYRTILVKTLSILKYNLFVDRNIKFGIRRQGALSPSTFTPNSSCDVGLVTSSLRLGFLFCETRGEEIRVVAYLVQQ